MNTERDMPTASEPEDQAKADEPVSEAAKGPEPPVGEGPHPDPAPEPGDTQQPLAVTVTDETREPWFRHAAWGVRDDGLPRWRRLWWFPIVAFAVMLVLVGLGITGSSTGVVQKQFVSAGGKDERLVIGTPRPIRSDEYFAQASWLLSQEKTGFHADSPAFPGGWDTTLHHDLPSKDWSVAFRPHLFPMLALPLDQGLSWRWWFPLWLVMVGSYLLAITIVPRRPAMAAFLAVAVGFSPFLQWWFLAVTLLPLGFCLVAMAGVWWSLRTRRSWERWAWAAFSAYLMVAMVMSIYAPFIIVVFWVFIVFMVAAILESRKELGLRGLGQVAIPYVVSAVAAIGVMFAWFASRKDTVDALMGTVYPGVRLTPTGEMRRAELIATFAAPWNWSFMASDEVTALGSNLSEASTPFMLGAFLAIPLLGLILTDIWGRRPVDWLAASVLVGLGIMMAFLLVPGWDWLAHLMVLDRTTPGRVRLAFLALGVLAVVAVVRRVPRSGSALPYTRHWAWGALGVTIAIQMAVLYWLIRWESPLLNVGWRWMLVCVLLCAAVGLTSFGRPTIGMALFLVGSLITTAGVNPLYRGVFDASTTEAGRKVERINNEHPGRWVGIGDMDKSVLLLHSGVPAYNGFQSYPPKAMWEKIDPQGRYEQEWNRLANVGWDLAPGPPVVTTPHLDQIRVSFDPCANFAQKNVEYVVSPTPLESQCVRPLDKVAHGVTAIWFYRVVPARRAVS